MLILKLTTPAKLAHNELRISGYGIKVSNVMCSKGSEYREFIDGLAGVGDKKNLFNPNNIRQTVLSLGAQNIEVVERENPGRCSVRNIPCKPNTKYTFKSNKDIRIAMGGITKDNIAFGDTGWINAKNGHTYTTPSGAVELGLNISKIDNINITVDFVKGIDIQKEEGSVATEFIPYDKCKIEILSCGKNLFNYKNNSNHIVSYGYGYPYETTGKFVDAVSQERYKDTGNGFWYKTPSNGNNNGLGFYIKCKKNTVYNFNCNASVVGGGYAIKCQGIYASEKPVKSIIEGRNLLINLDLQTNPTVSQVFNSQNYDYLFFYLGGAWVSNPTSPVELTFTNIILEENSNFTGYIPYIEDKKQILLQEPLYSLPNGVCDTIEKIDSNYAVVRRCGQMIINGSEDWKYHSMVFNGQSVRCILNMSNLKTANSKDQARLLCDKLIVGVDSSEFMDTNNAVNSIFQRIDPSNAALYIAIKISDCDVRVDDSAHQKCAKVKAWLKDNPVTVWYELAMPMKEGYIPQNLNLDTYNETTHITSNTLVPAIINVKIPTNVGAVIKSDIKRIEAIEDLIDKVMLPQLVESHYKKTLLEFDYEVSRMLK